MHHLCLDPHPLQDRFRAHLLSQEQHTGPIQLHLAIAETDLLHWLAAQMFPRWFWAHRDRETQVAAVGQVQVWHDLQAVSAFLAQAPAEMRCYGGWGFDPNHSSPYAAPWQDWPAQWFFLPRWELRHQGQETRLCVNLLAAPDQRETELDAALQTLQEPTPAMPPHQPELTAAAHLLAPLQHQPNLNEWRSQLAAVLPQLQAGELKKIVLSRCSQAPVTGFDLSLLVRLLQQQRRAYHFWFQPQAQQVLWGASPERLYARQGRCLQTEALAGTRPCSADPAIHQQLQQDLLDSAKERSEQERVQEHLLLQLGPLSTQVERHPLEVVAAGPVQHLYRRLHAQLLPEVSDAQLVQALHPTPAVNGFPVAQSQAQIAALESHERGWYSGALGWVSGQAAEWTVTLRTALWQQDQMYFFTGAGIMPCSEPEAEWRELDAKLQSLLGLFTEA